LTRASFARLLRLSQQTFEKEVAMKQRVVAIVAQYLEQRIRGRIVHLRPCGEDDLIVAVEDIRDGRVHLLHSLGDLEEWLTNFKEGRCLQPAAAICDVCEKPHADRTLDG
jgi:hypothetical protein